MVRSMMRAFFFIGCIGQLLGVSFNDFDVYQNQLTFEEVESKIKKFLEKEPEVNRFYRLTEDRFELINPDQKTIDYTLYLGSSDQKTLPLTFSIFKNSSNRSKKIKIAIDAGHFGGDLARLEQRYIDIPETELGTKEAIRFDEGTLALLTALELRNLLQKEGFEVFLSRKEIGKGAIKKDFFDWLKDNKALWESKKNLSELFTLYNQADLICRAQLINDFQPDLTLIIHYNASGIKRREDGTNPLSPLNYNLAFIPGSFGKNELNTEEDRYEFLRLIVTDDLDQSLSLSRKIVEHFTIELKLPLMDLSHLLPSQTLWTIHEKGIFGRNLSLTRRIHGPLCYGETLIQDNELECQILSLKNAEIEGIVCSSRIKQVAQAYLKGILAYLKNK